MARVPSSRDGRDYAPNPEASRDPRETRALQPTLRVGTGLVKSISQQAGAGGLGRTAAPVLSRTIASPKHVKDGRSVMPEPVLSRSTSSLDKARSSKYRPLPQGRGIFFPCVLCCLWYLDLIVSPRSGRDLNNWGLSFLDSWWGVPRSFSRPPFSDRCCQPAV
jgi:hypothetical protein